MNILNFLLYLLAVASFSFCEDHGVQMRLTRKGMDYTVNVATNIMKKDLTKMKISKNGTYSNGDYQISNMTFNNVDFGDFSLDPIKGIGIMGVVSGINIEANADLKFTYTFWFTFADETSFVIKATDIDFSLLLKIGKDTGGRATISVLECKANVGQIDLMFKGGLSSLYNFMSSLMKKEMANTLKQSLCDMATVEINTKAKQELETFPVIREINDFAEIDYRLIEAPVFTNTYMDILLKGKFKLSKYVREFNLTIPRILTSKDDEKMVYFWITDYTFNTAGLIYHQEKKLKIDIHPEDKTFKGLKSLLQTTNFASVFPKILLEHPNERMGVSLYSYKPPFISIAEEEIKLNLFVICKFFVGNDKELFTLKFNVKAGIILSVHKTNLTGRIVHLNYKTDVIQSIYGQPLVSLEGHVVEKLINLLVIKNVNAHFQRGFPLPKVSGVSFTNAQIKLRKDVIEIGTDLTRKF